MVKPRGIVDVVKLPALNRFGKPSTAPKYPRRASQEALQVVTGTLAAKGCPLHTQELWDAIHQHFPQHSAASTTPPLEQIPQKRQTRYGKLLVKPPLPPKPEHVIRSKSFLKECLATLENYGRVRKTMSHRPPKDAQERYALEREQSRVEVRNALKRAKGQPANSIARPEVHHWVWNLVPPREDQVPLEDRWDQVAEEVAHKNRQRLLHSATQSWGIPADQRASLSEDHMQEALDAYTRKKKQSQGRKRKQERAALPLKEHGTIPALRFGSERRFGLHYGLPKNRKLLEMANARKDDQVPWSIQPRADFTHLNSRRLEAREHDLRADQRAERLIAREAAHLQ